MARNVAQAVENNFVRGLITEASGLNFPENACVETDNCHFDLTGEVRRRLGIDFEQSNDTKAIDRTNAAINTYLWKNVGGNGNVSIWVVQVGDTLYFYLVSAGLSLSAGELATTVDLTTYMPAGAPSPETLECQFATGNGYLFVTHPTLDSIYVTYNATTQAVTATEITLYIRDFVGIAEANVAVDLRSGTLTDAHNYNLGNQGWSFSSYDVETSATSLTPAAGSTVFTVDASGPWVAGDSVYIWSESSMNDDDGLHYFVGDVTSYSGTTLTIDVGSFGPLVSGGAKTDWKITNAPDHIVQFESAVKKYPSNADIWWDYKDANDQFSPGKTIATVNRGSTPAPKGHYILQLYDQQRDTVSGISGLTDVTTSYYRAAACAFFAGRIFYAGIPYGAYGSNIYFSQILQQDSTKEFGYCYQAADPTNEYLFDLLPNDGGVITIPEAGTVHKLWSMQGGLIVFASNGIWQISGSTGTGFTANDYSVRQLSSIRILSATSFVDIHGFPAFWAAEGIYLLQPDSVGSGVVVKSLTDETILTYYNEIPANCKKQARGYFDLVTKKAQWLFRDEDPGSVEEIYEYNNILIFNARTAAFNPWSVTVTDVSIHGIVVLDSIAGSLEQSTVIRDNLDTVVSDAAETVVSLAITTGGSVSTRPSFKYLVSYDDSGTKFTVAEEHDDQYVDWYSFDDTGVDYESYFISGYKVHGKAQNKFQSNYIYIFSKAVPSVYNFMAIWDYATSGDTGSWSSVAHVTVTDTEYSVKRNRLKIRGEGLALQFKVTSESGEPFNLIGWSSWETGNASI